MLLDYPPPLFKRIAVGDGEASEEIALVERNGGAQPCQTGRARGDLRMGMGAGFRQQLGKARYIHCNRGGRVELHGLPRRQQPGHAPTITVTVTVTITEEQPQLMQALT